MAGLTLDELVALEERLHDEELNRICAVRMARRDLDNLKLESCMARLRGDLDKYYDDPLGVLVKKFFDI